MAIVKNCTKKIKLWPALIKAILLTNGIYRRDVTPTEFEDFTKDSKSSRHAINFVLTAHHLKEWVWKSYLKNNKELRNKISTEIEQSKDFYSFISKDCHEIELIREIANNIKHFYAQRSQIRETNSGNNKWGEITCLWENWKVRWGYNGLIVITEDNHWLSALDIFQRVHDFWVEYFASYLLSCE